MKSSGRFAALTLLAGLLAACSLSVLWGSSETEVAIVTAPPAAVIAAPSIAPMVTTQTAPASPAKAIAVCPQAAQAHRAHQRAAAYALIGHEGPAADAGDDGGFFGDSLDTFCSGQQVSYR